MLKTFHLSGYAVNKRGNTVGIHYEIAAPNIDKARLAAEQEATAEGYRYPRLLRVKHAVTESENYHSATDLIS